MLTNKLMGTKGASLTQFEATISTNQQEMNLATWATSQGWNGSDEAQITLEEGVYIWSDSIATPALTTGNFPSGLTLIVNGYIIGKGGVGAGTTDASVGDTIPSENGGPAISLGCDLTILGGSSGYIGGGGGGGGAVIYTPGGLGERVHQAGGGGAGGGAGGSAGENSGGAGGTVGNPGSAGSASQPVTQQAQGGGAGGGGAGGEIGV